MTDNLVTVVDIQPEGDRDLVIARLIAAPAHALYRCWTEPELLVQWFAPKPHTTEVLEHELKVGGRQRLVMRDPEGNAHSSEGVYLELVPDRRVVFTDLFERAWVPSANPMMTGELSFEDKGNGKTLYVARVRHPSVEATKAHAEMGFTEGWGICAAQLAELAARL